MGVDRAVRSATVVETMIAAVMETPIHRFLNLLLLERGSRVAVLEFEVGDHAVSPGGALHGGVLSLAMEPAAYLAVLPLIDADKVPVTIDFHARPMRPILRGETVQLSARVIRHGRTMAFCEVDATVGGDLRAKGSILKALVGSRN
jgi:uncharacterized protein (TIGR00369 family)